MPHNSTNICFESILNLLWYLIWLRIYATLTSFYIFQKTMECKLPLLRLCHHGLASSAKTLVLTVQPNLMTLLSV